MIKTWTSFSVSHRANGRLDCQSCPHFSNPRPFSCYKWRDIMEHAYITPQFKTLYWLPVLPLGEIRAPEYGPLWSSLPPSPGTSLAAFLPAYTSYQQLRLHLQEPGHFWFSIPNGQIYSQFRNGDYFPSQVFFGCRLSVLGLRNMEMCRKQSLFLEKERGAYWEAGTEWMETGGVNKSGCVWAGINRLVQLEHRVSGWEGQKVKPKK